MNVSIVLTEVDDFSGNDINSLMRGYLDQVSILRREFESLAVVIYERMNPESHTKSKGLKLGSSFVTYSLHAQENEKCYISSGDS